MKYPIGTVFRHVSGSTITVIRYNHRGYVCDVNDITSCFTLNYSETSLNAKLNTGWHIEHVGHKVTSVEGTKPRNTLSRSVIEAAIRDAYRAGQEYGAKNPMMPPRDGTEKIIEELFGKVK